MKKFYASYVKSLRNVTKSHLKQEQTVISDFDLNVFKSKRVYCVTLFEFKNILCDGLHGMH